MIHPSAVIGPEVELDEGVEIGPFCYLMGRIKLGPANRLISHVTILGDTELGPANVLHSNVVIGDEPQDVEYRGGRREVRIGARNIFREGVTIHRGSEHGERTVIGDDNFLMQNAHVAHDCRIGNFTIIAGGAILAGWVEVADRAIISGNCAVHQYVRIGRLAFMRGLARTSRDVPPFCVLSDTHTVRAINVVGLRRAGFAPATIGALRQAFKILFGRRRNLRLALAELVAQGPRGAEVDELVEFIRQSRRGVAFGPAQASDAAQSE
ncbi:MAG TPA: acyl-ACP--UDP-N-acetylglucosamine O-acyltransferase [Candidatus Binataceae bacterium]|nr:acyl-ACP--UDP-N-acetylglucosamine O-acyltransferase [Candidatus Binataceae bacterium]